MARLHINLPEKFLFSTEIAVRVSDLNYGGHVARMQFYRNLGFKDETSFEGSVGQIIVDASVQYKAESFLGDVLVVRIAAEDLTRFGFDLLYHVKNKATDQEVARGKTGIVCFDYSRKKVVSIPSPLLTKLHNTTN
jgi:acyl-CoA thioester hydrolase